MASALAASSRGARPACQEPRGRGARGTCAGGGGLFASLPRTHFRHAAGLVARGGSGHVG